MKEEEFFYNLVLKVSSRCNLNCTYCHWFRDESVYREPPLIKKEIFDDLIKKLKIYLLKTRQKKLRFIFHGGEPLLLKKLYFDYMCTELRRLEAEAGTKIILGLTTNAVLVTEEWVELFKKHRVGVSVSIDGTPEIHDKFRVDLKGRGTYDRVIRGLNQLKSAYNSVSVLAVAQPDQSPKSVCEHLFNTLGIKHCDILIPNYNHDEKKIGLVKPIADYYIELFDLWFEAYRHQGVKIRAIQAFIDALLGKSTKYPGIGRNPIKVVSVTPSGEIEPHDVLRINGVEQVSTGLCVSEHQFDEILKHELWLNTLRTSLTLPDECQNCPIRQTCRGGSIIHRYSTESGYNNPSIYCEDLKQIYAHISRRITVLKEAA